MLNDMCIYIYIYSRIYIYKYHLTICTLIYPQTEEVHALCSKVSKLPSHIKKKKKNLMSSTLQWK